MVNDLVHPVKIPATESVELQQETRRLGQYNENIDLSSEKLNSVYGAIQAVKVSDRGSWPPWLMT